MFGQFLLIVAGLAAGVVAWAVATYNKLVKLRNMKEEGWSGIDVQLKRRSDLVPNLIATVKGYMVHESDVLQGVTELRSRAKAAKNPADKMKAESAFGLGIGRLIAVAESYPDLKANVNFLELQKELNQIEEQLQMARRYYNGTVRNLNTAIEVFPNSVIAKRYNFVPGEYFEIEDPREREVPKVDFSSSAN
jgi:LemA protein